MEIMISDNCVQLEITMEKGGMTIARKPAGLRVPYHSAFSRFVIQGLKISVLIARTPRVFLQRGLFVTDDPGFASADPNRWASADPTAERDRKSWAISSSGTGATCGDNHEHSLAARQSERWQIVGMG